MKFDPHYDIALSVQVPSSSTPGLAHNVSFTLSAGWDCTCPATGGHCRHIRAAATGVAKLMIDSEIMARDRAEHARLVRRARARLLNGDPGMEGPPPPVDTANLASLAAWRRHRDLDGWVCGSCGSSSPRIEHLGCPECAEHVEHDARGRGLTPGQEAARIFGARRPAS